MSCTKIRVTVKDRLKEICIDEDMTNPHSDKAFMAARRLLQRILEQYPNKKVGFFCSNDDIANLLQRECIIRGVNIPEDVEIIGYDNSPISDYAVYPITSISQNIPLMARIAIESLDNYIPHESLVPAMLINKSTTKSLPELV